MKNSLAMRVSDRARNLGHHPHTLAGLFAKRSGSVTQAPARRVFHAEKRQALFTFTNLVNRKNVWMIEAGDGFGFAPKAHQCLVRIHIMSEDAFHRDDPTGMLL